MYEFQYSTQLYNKPANVCPECDGWGYFDREDSDKSCAPEMKGKKTVALGSGCFKCKGIGRLAEW